MKRILFINGGPLRRGGIETFMMNVYRNIDKHKYKIDFAVRGGEKGVYDDEILENGSEIFRLPLRSKHPIKYMISLYRIFTNNSFDIVHAQLDAMNGLVLLVAKICKVPVRISHSHNTAPMTKNTLKKAFQAVSRNLIYTNATALWACSKVAGQWLYGNRKFTVIHNAIDLSHFQFDPVHRTLLRERLGIKKEIVLGSVGRLDYQKNPEFLIRIIRDGLDLGMNLVAVFVGDGSDGEHLKDLAKQLNVSDRVKFVGNQDNIQDWYNMFDYFLLSSRFEGLPLVAIEAQANGLKCLISDQVSEEVALSNQVHMLPIADTAEWLKTLNTVSPDRDADCYQHCVEAGYSLRDEVSRIEQLYDSEVGKN